MATSALSLRQAHRVRQAGILLFLLALLVGLAIPQFAVPRLGLSAHLLGLMQGNFLVVLGMLWPQLKLTPATARVGFWLVHYRFFAAWAVNVAAGVWGQETQWCRWRQDRRAAARYRRESSR